MAVVAAIAASQVTTTKVSRCSEFLAERNNKEPVQLPKRIVFIRHGESRGNASSSTKAEYRATQDHKITLTNKGHEQAVDAGERLAGLLREDAPAGRIKLFCSTYERARQTLDGILKSIPVSFRTGPITYDNLLREFDRGYYGLTQEDVQQQNAARKAFGNGQFRFRNGESIEDVYHRASSFVSLLQGWLQGGPLSRTDSVVAVCHSALMLELSNRLLGLPVEGVGNVDEGERWFPKFAASVPNCAILVFERFEVDQLRSDGSLRQVTVYSPDIATHKMLGTLREGETAHDAAVRLVGELALGPLVFAR